MEFLKKNKNIFLRALLLSVFIVPSLMQGAQEQHSGDDVSPEEIVAPTKKRKRADSEVDQKSADDKPKQRQRWSCNEKSREKFKKLIERNSAIAHLKVKPKIKEVCKKVRPTVVKHLWLHMKQAHLDLDQISEAEGECLRALEPQFIPEKPKKKIRSEKAYARDWYCNESNHKNFQEAMSKNSETNLIPIKGKEACGRYLGFNRPELLLQHMFHAHTDLNMKFRKGSLPFTDLSPKDKKIWNLVNECFEPRKANQGVSSKSEKSEKESHSKKKCKRGDWRCTKDNFDTFIEVMGQSPETAQGLIDDEQNTYCHAELCSKEAFLAHMISKHTCWDMGINMRRFDYTELSAKDKKIWDLLEQNFEPKKVERHNQPDSEPGQHSKKRKKPQITKKKNPKKPKLTVQTDSPSSASDMAPIVISETQSTRPPEPSYTSNIPAAAISNDAASNDMDQSQDQNGSEWAPMRDPRLMFAANEMNAASLINDEDLASFQLNMMPLDGAQELNNDE